MGEVFPEIETMYSKGGFGILTQVKNQINEDVEIISQIRVNPRKFAVVPCKMIR